MSRSCEMKSAILENDLKKLGFKGGLFTLCILCQKKYGMIIRETEKNVFLDVMIREFLSR